MPSRDTSCSENVHCTNEMIGLASLVGPIVNKFVDRIPNGNERARAKEALEKELVEAANSVMLAQTEINAAEAQHKSIFVAGWRPFIGWVCGVGIAWSMVVQPVAQWAMIAWGDGTELPTIDTSYLMELVTAMLGMSGLRTFEKMRGVARRK